MIPISLITPTGDRPEALALCAKYISRSTYKGPIEWVVIDDGIEPVEFETSEQIAYIRRPEPRSNSAAGSLGRNIAVGLSMVTYDHVLIIEDDDWYHPDYISVMAEALETHDLVGETPSIYYNLRENVWQQTQHENHASLCQTGFNMRIVNQVWYHCRTASPFIDKALWGDKRITNRRLISGRQLCVGIKGMPGRNGYGIGHRPDAEFTSDPDRSKLRELIGREDCLKYEMYH